MAKKPSLSSIELMRAAGLQVQDLAAVLAGLRPMCRLGLRRGGSARRLLKATAQAGNLAVHSYRSEYEGGREENVLLGPDSARLLAFAEVVTRKSRARTSAESRAATREMGGLLGYPDCCTRAFAATERGRGDVPFAQRRFQGAGVGPHVFVTNWLYNFHSRSGAELNRMLREGYRGMDFYLVPWVPCELACPSTIRYGRGLLRVLTQVAPSFAAGLTETLKAPVVFWDDWQFAPLQAARFRGEVCTYHGAANLRTLLPAASWKVLNEGTQVRPRRGALQVLQDGKETARLRGAQLLRFK
jgi:hypothetical protein